MTLRIQIESFAACVHELDPLFVKHHAELGMWKDCMPLLPQYEEYSKREKLGMLFLTTVRKDGKLVGYYIVQIAIGFHYACTLIAHQDIVYIAPEVRGRGYIFRLMDFVERELRARGVNLWLLSYKIHNDLGFPRVLDKMGFVPVDQTRGKWLGG